jgi:beta-glucanase (GH16 family)
VADGALKLTVRKEAAPVSCVGGRPAGYTSGMVSTNPKPTPGVGFAQTNGRYEIRAKITGAKVRGLQESFWMWPVDQVGSWPWSGEIDIAEIYHLYPDRAIPYIHYSNPFDYSSTNNYCLVDDISKYHTYLLEWTPVSLKISFDGTVCIDDHWTPWFQAGRAPFDAPFYLILTQALGIGANAFDPVTTPLPASTLVDYVRIWK